MFTQEADKYVFFHIFYMTIINVFIYLNTYFERRMGFWPGDSVLRRSPVVRAGYASTPWRRC